ncbi:MAG: DUF2236 domain-containing protein [Acidimicrobiia bacterium]|nr:DUF2236 domain-containing protein [Acidimicrobiia bacterium]MCY4433586.1 oxygenase MpaB family protein [bacterium]
MVLHDQHDWLLMNQLPNNTPTDYQHEGYSRAQALDPEMAKNYVAHTMIGDPLADAAIEALSSMKRSESSRIIAAFMESADGKDHAHAPDAVHEFFAHAAKPPDWFDQSALAPGVRMFHRNSTQVGFGMVGGVLIEGFKTNISRSFFITGRLRDQGVRRLQQNNRHMLEIFIPGGLERFGDGWKLSVRVRLVHAQVRHLLANTEDWDTGAWGVPVSSAHTGFALAAFSARLLKHMRSLGARFNKEEAASFMEVWRYTGYLMGVPETILVQNEAHALKLYDVGTLCEPEPGPTSRALAHSVVNSAPLVIGIGAEDPSERQNLSKYIYRVSRALIGNPLANKLHFPKQSKFGVLMRFRVPAMVSHTLSNRFKKYSRKSSYVRFSAYLTGTLYDEEGITYKLPDKAYAEESSSW